MRLVLLILFFLAAVAAAGWWLMPLLFAHAPALLGVLGVLLLLAALLVPGKPKCTGMHCSGCNH